MENQPVPGVSSIQPATPAQDTNIPASQPTPGMVQTPATGDYVPRERLNEVIAERNALREQTQQREQPTANPEKTQEAEVSYYKKLFQVPDDERIAQIAIEKAKEIARQEIDNQENIRRMDMEAQRLQLKYNGEDGNTKFETVKAIEYGQKHGILNMEVAYREMVREEKETQVANTPTYTEMPTSGASVSKKSTEKAFEDYSLEEMEKMLPHAA